MSRTIVLPLALAALVSTACSVDVASLDLPSVPGDGGFDPGPADVPTPDAVPDLAPDPGPGEDPGGEDAGMDTVPADTTTGDETALDLAVDPGDAADAGEDTAPWDPGAVDTTCVPNCDGKTCVDDDGCGTPCGCPLRHTCVATQGACVFSDWDGTYRGAFQSRVTVRMTGLPDQTAGCEGNLAITVRGDSRPAITGSGKCTVQVSLTTVVFYVDLQGDVVDLVKAEGMATYSNDNGTLGASGFAGSFGGPKPRGLEGELFGGVSFIDGLTKIVYDGGSFQVTEVL